MNTPVHEYVSTKQDFADAQRLHRSNRPRFAVWYWLWYGVLPGLSVVYLMYWAALWITRGQGWALHNAAWAGLALYIAVMLPFGRWWQIRRLWDRTQPKKYRGEPVTFQFDEQQLISARPGSSEGRFQWNAIEDYAEDERLAILYVQRKLFLFVPKRAMDEAEWERLRAIAAERKAKR